MRKKARNSNVELLRIISLFLIILGHFTWQTHWSFNRTPLILEGSIHSLWIGGKLGVDIFVLISGYYLIKASFKVSSFFRVWIQALFYAIITMVIIFFTHIVPMSTKDIVKTIFLFNFGYVNWFVTAYLVMYLLSPFLNVILRRLDQKHFQGLLIILLFLSLIRSVFNNMAIGTSGNDAVWLLIVYCFGAYIRIFKDNFSWGQRVYYIGLIISLGLSITSVFILDFFQKYYFISSDPRFYGKFIDGFSPLQIISAVMIFMLFIRKKPYNSILINKIASTTFGIYLIHANFLIVDWLWNKVVQGYQYEGTYFVLLYAVFVSVTIFIICSIVDLTRQLLLGKIELIIVGRIKTSWIGKKINMIENL